MPPPRAGSNVFRAVADPTRRRVLEILREEERSVGEIQRATRAGQSALSQHLAVLHRAGLVSRRRDGQRRLYRVNPGPLRRLADWVEYFNCFWDDRLERLNAYLERRR